MQTVSAGMMDVNFSYTRDGGFGGGLSFGNNTTFHAGVGYTTKSKDWNANAGYGKTTVGVSKTKQGGWGGSFQAGAYEVSYSEKNGFGAAISVPMGKDGKYGSMRFGVQFDDHMGWKGADVSYTTKETAGKQFGGTQTFGLGYNEDSGYRLTASTNVKTAGGLRANTTNSFSFDKDGTFSGAAIDASMRFTYVNYQDMRERSKRTDEEMSAAEREAAERAREEMGWFDRAADMLSGAWLSMNGTLGQWEKDITKMISDFGESLGNWFTGDGFYTNNEMAVNAAMKELGRQEAVAAALGAHEEFSKNYDVAVKGAMGEYDRMQVAYKAANNEMDRINAGYKQAYNYGWGAYVGECLKDSLSKGANGGYEASFHGTTFKLTDQVFNFAKMSVNQNSAGQIIDKLHPDSLVMFSNLVHEMDVSSITFSSLYRPNDPIHGEGRGIDITKITDSSGREAVYNGTNGDNSDYMGELRNWFGSQSNVTQVIDPWKIKLSPNAIAIDNEWQGYLKLYGEETLKSSKNELEMVKLHWQHRHHLHLTIKTR